VGRRSAFWSAARKVRVARAFAGDTLKLEDGTRVFLAEIDAPRGDAPMQRNRRANSKRWLYIARYC
jgi:endonuclease YncB( thermonuclease family)